MRRFIIAAAAILMIGGASTADAVKLRKISSAALLTDLQQPNISYGMAVRIMRELGPKRKYAPAASTFQSFAYHEHQSVRKMAIVGLGHLRDTNSITLLRDILENAQVMFTQDDRKAAALALGMISTATAGHDDLIWYLENDPDPEVRAACVRGLGYVNTQAAATAIQAAKSDSSLKVQNAAAEASP